MEELEESSDRGLRLECPINPPLSVLYNEVHDRSFADLVLVETVKEWTYLGIWWRSNNSKEGHNRWPRMRCFY